MNNTETAIDAGSIGSGEAATLAPSRRSMLKSVALGMAAAGAATVVAGGRPASAADGEDVTLGQAKDFTTATNVNYKGANVASSFNVQSGDDTANNVTNNGILNNSFANAGTALLGVANGNGPQGIGIIGWSKKPLGTGIVGFTGGAGAYGGEFFGGLAEVRLRPGGAAPITLANGHLAGELYEDETGALWICVVAGTPGTWREIAGPTTAGAFHAIAPRRVYDSRSTSKLPYGVDRDISVATATDGTANVVPAGAVAVALTVTITETEGTGGFVSVRPQGTADQGTSSINWYGPNQSLATTVITGLGGDRQITAKAGSANTHFVVDVTGFYR